MPVRDIFKLGPNSNVSALQINIYHNHTASGSTNTSKNTHTLLQSLLPCSSKDNNLNISFLVIICCAPKFSGVHCMAPFFFGQMHRSGTEASSYSIHLFTTYETGCWDEIISAFYVYVLTTESTVILWD